SQVDHRRRRVRDGRRHRGGRPEHARRAGDPRAADGRAGGPLAAVSDDVCLDAVKTGMLGTVDVIETVAEWIAAHPPRVLVVDPVMVATSGDRLLDPAAEQAMLRFCRAASVVTPNID